MTFRPKFRLVSVFACSAFLAACAGGDVQYEYPDTSGKKRAGSFYENDDPLFGEDGINIFGGDDNSAENNNGSGNGIGVNSFLWRASLDTISFLPLASADPFGGVIITDWHIDPNIPNERVKLQIYILDRQLRSDGLRVTMFREALVEGQWVSQSISSRTIRSIEDSILARARELRIQSSA